MTSTVKSKNVGGQEDNGHLNCIVCNGSGHLRWECPTARAWLKSGYCDCRFLVADKYAAKYDNRGVRTTS